MSDYVTLCEKCQSGEDDKDREIKKLRRKVEKLKSKTLLAMDNAALRAKNEDAEKKWMKYRSAYKESASVNAALRTRIAELEEMMKLDGSWSDAYKWNMNGIDERIKLQEQIAAKDKRIAILESLCDRCKVSRKYGGCCEDYAGELNKQIAALTKAGDAMNECLEHDGCSFSCSQIDKCSSGIPMQEVYSAWRKAKGEGE